MTNHRAEGFADPQTIVRAIEAVFPSTQGWAVSILNNMFDPRGGAVVDIYKGPLRMEPQHIKYEEIAKHSEDDADWWIRALSELRTKFEETIS